MMTPESIDAYKRLASKKGNSDTPGGSRIPDRKFPITQARNRKTDPTKKFPGMPPETPGDQAIHKSYEQMTQGTFESQKRMKRYNGPWKDVLGKNKTNILKDSP